MENSLIQISKEDFKNQLLMIHKLGYKEGCEDVIKNIIISLKNIEKINNTNAFSINETISFLQSVEINPYNY